jgi:hypothetical protein
MAIRSLLSFSCSLISLTKLFCKEIGKEEAEEAQGHWGGSEGVNQNLVTHLSIFRVRVATIQFKERFLIPSSFSPLNPGLLWTFFGKNLMPNPAKCG